MCAEAPQKEPPTCTPAPHNPYSQVPPMDQSWGRGTSNPIRQSHSHRSLQEVRLAWCLMLTGVCSRGGLSGAHGRRGHNVQEGSRHRCRTWSGTSCSLRHGASMLPLCRPWFAKSVEFLPRPLACSKPRQAPDQIPCDHGQLSESHLSVKRDKDKEHLNNDVTCFPCPFEPFQDICLS